MQYTYFLNIVLDLSLWVNKTNQRRFRMLSAILLKECFLYIKTRKPFSIAQLLPCFRLPKKLIKKEIKKQTELDANMLQSSCSYFSTRAVLKMDNDDVICSITNLLTYHFLYMLQ